MALNQGWIYHDRISAQDAGTTALDYYAQRYRHSSPEQWRDRLIQGQIHHKGQPLQPETLLQQGWELTYQRSPWQEPDVPLKIEVLYDDGDLLAIAKPSGLPVLPGGGFVTHTVLHQLQLRLGCPTIYPLHRLGRGTSGLLLLARSPTLRAALSQQFRHHHIHKLYRALVGPGEIPDQGVITAKIGKLPHPHLGYIYGATPQGKTAWSCFQVCDRRPDSTLLEVDIQTGRPHQIRIHLAALGYPLLGDPLYIAGGLPNPERPDVTPGDCGYCLHAHRLQFSHPTTGQALRLTATPPARLQYQV